MTPLAHRLATTLSRVKAERQPGVVAALNGAHFFEMTEATAIGEEVCATINKTHQNGEAFTPCTFLPAPNTWLEWRRNTGRHTAVSPRYVSDVNKAAVRVFSELSDGQISANAVGTIDLKTGETYYLNDFIGSYPEAKDWALEMLSKAAIFLAIVNSPRIVGRRTHPPRKTVARKLQRSGVDIGPLHDWHEIKLEINKPQDIYDGEPHADVITGKRALHFCRKHLRLWNGRLIPVREHWRGDPSIGIRRGRYVAVAPPGAQP